MRTHGAMIALLVGCAGAPAPVAGPEATLEAYTEALRAGDARRLYALLDPATQEAVPFEEFAATLESNRDELAERAQEVEDRVKADEVVSRAEVPLRDGEKAILTLEHGRWALLGGVLDAPALQTPLDAVLALRHAVRRRSLRGLDRVLGREARAALEDERRRFLEETADSLDLEVEIQGNEARVRLTGGRVIRLVREAGEWRVVDVE
ncbi:MAG: hypothetical protein CMN30_15360 [Sandaracinus sp.]|mgnify:CR=1 FL=1|nr:hypothetical protein [Sandaracinus sp.]